MSRKFVSTICIIVLCLAYNFALADSHRMETTPTDWWWYHSQSDADIVNVIDETGSRLIDIEIQSTEPLRFAAAFVHNSGVYAETWWWFFDQTPGDIETLLNRNEARLIDIERYETENGPRYAVIMVDNSGADAKDWWWYVGGDEVFLAGVLDDNNARLVDFEAYEDGGTKYAAIMIENTGEDAMEWWWYIDVPATTIWNNIAAHGTRLLEYQVRDPVAGTFDAILIPHRETDNINWWWYYNVNDTQLNALINQNGARITDLDTYLNGIERRYSVVMVNNSNALTTKMGNLLGYGTDGATGAYLKEVGGPVLASLQPDFVYEPSSSLKVTHHLYAVRKVMLGADHLHNDLTVAEGSDGSCPNDGPPYTVKSLMEALGGMMWRSDNNDTRAVELRYGRAAINDTSQSLVGMTDTAIGRRMGCVGPPFNETTLADMARLYEGVAQGLYLDSYHRDVFYLLMLGENSNPRGWFGDDLESLIHEVATDLGVPEAAADYWSGTRLAWKAGWDTMPAEEGGPNVYYRSVAGWVSLPWECAGSRSLRKDFAFGLFVNWAVDEAYSWDRIFGTVEMFREQVTAGLTACVSAVDEVPAARQVLEQNVPNPFNPLTRIAFDLPEPEAVSLRVFDVAGRLVRVLIGGEVYGEGHHEAVWNGRDDRGRQLASGTYFYRLTAGSYTETKRMVLVK